MAEAKKPKTIKKVTEIPNAKVTIEVEETEKNAAVAVEEDKTSETVDTVEKTQPEEVTQSVDSSESSGGISWKKIILIMLIVVPIGFLAFGGFLFFSKDFNARFLKKEPKKTINLPQASPTPTEATVDKEAYEIEVQNGSGIAGEGARVKEILDKAGFKTAAVGNAQNSDYTDTIITVNDEVSDGFIEELTKVLEERGSVGKVEKFALGEEGEVLVIVGSDLTESPTPEE